MSVARVGQPVLEVRDHPDGARIRQLLLGATLEILETEGSWGYVRVTQGGYMGWVHTSGLAAPQPATHWVSAPATHAYTRADFKSAERLSLSLGSQLVVTGQTERFWETDQGFVPIAHLRALSDYASDPVEVAEWLLGTPYLWGGNSRFGIDCSGLVQVVCHLCGLPCPADSGPQERDLGQALPEGTSFRRGDLLFWKGHVAWVLDERRLLHANAYTMSVAVEDLTQAVERIESQGDGPVTSHKRLMR